MGKVSAVNSAVAVHTKSNAVVYRKPQGLVCRVVSKMVGVKSFCCSTKPAYMPVLCKHISPPSFKGSNITKPSWVRSAPLPHRMTFPYFMCRRTGATAELRVFSNRAAHQALLAWSAARPAKFRTILRTVGTERKDFISFAAQLTDKANLVFRRIGFVVSVFTKTVQAAVNSFRVSRAKNRAAVCTFLVLPLCCVVVPSLKSLRLSVSKSQRNLGSATTFAIRHAGIVPLGASYVDVAITRWQEYTGEVAVRQDGRDFLDIKVNG